MARAWAVMWESTNGIRYSVHSSRSHVSPFFARRTGPDGLMRIKEQWAVNLASSVQSIVDQSEYGIYLGERPR